MVSDFITNHPEMPVFKLTDDGKKIVQTYEPEFLEPGNLNFFHISKILIKILKHSLFKFCNSHNFTRKR
jgi:hypothetical protein